MNQVLVTNESYKDHPALDVAVSHAVLDAVAAGEIGSVFRLHPAHPVLAFGMADRIQPGYPAAVRVAAAHGFVPVERLAGGRAAVFHERTLAFSWAMAEDDPRTGISQRFRLVSAMMRDAFRSLKIDARVGEIPGEYCPGEYSVNVGGVVKVMGVGQRLVKGAAHIGGVIVVDDGDRIRDVLIPVYRALRIDWDPRTAGALADRSAGTKTGDVADAVVAQLKETTEVVSGTIPDEIIERGRTMIERHIPAAS
ncbi:MAG: lipoate--protein ligase family protein [Acidimicrobiia bacterium]